MRLVLAALLMVVPGSLHAEMREEDFYGTWIPSDETVRSCMIEGEGAHFTVHRNYYQPGDGAACVEAKTWLRNGRLRISATCEGEEYGFRATTRELKLETDATLTTAVPGRKAHERFVLCTMPRVAMTAAQVVALPAALGEIEKLEASALDQSPQTDATEARLAKGRDDIATKHGYKSAAQLAEVKLVALDILQFGAEADYLSRRHAPSNVAAVMANKTVLESLLPRPSEPEQTPPHKPAQ